MTMMFCPNCQSVNECILSESQPQLRTVNYCSLGANAYKRVRACKSCFKSFDTFELDRSSLNALIFDVSEEPKDSFRLPSNLAKDPTFPGLHELILEAFNGLTRLESDVLKIVCGFYSGKPEGDAETARLMCLPKQKTQEVQQKALRKLRHPMRAEDIKRYHEVLIRINNPKWSPEIELLYRLFGKYDHA